MEGYDGMVIMNSNGDLTEIAEIKNMSAQIIELPSNGLGSFFCFVVDAPRNLKLWISEELDRDMISKLRVGDVIKYSAEQDDDGDMLITELEVSLYGA